MEEDLDLCPKDLKDSDSGTYSIDDSTPKDEEFVGPCAIDGESLITSVTGEKNEIDKAVEISSEIPSTTDSEANFKTDKKSVEPGEVILNEDEIYEISNKVAKHWSEFFCNVTFLKDPFGMSDDILGHLKQLCQLCFDFQLHGDAEKSLTFLAELVSARNMPSLSEEIPKMTDGNELQSRNKDLLEGRCEDFQMSLFLKCYFPYLELARILTTLRQLNGFDKANQFEALLKCLEGMYICVTLKSLKLLIWMYG